ncbi:unnamed protein product [Dracunculus medinensis]|uniref:Uncharacterized protein n=1 Tax=Dracunculus medinensis TaxID=318479 RepID=A0A3P7Q9X3_DRAME|nr:unnamed protein product [Dracunculus medinensis]
MEKLQDVNHCMERALLTLELISNRSDKDKKRLELFFPILEKFYYILILNYLDIPGNVSWQVGGPVHSGTLSVLSDDSFLSALDDMVFFQPLSLDDSDILMRDPLNIEKSSLFFYQSGMACAISDEVFYRKSRTEFCCCENDLDFMAKLWCLRQAFNKILSDERNRVWLTQTGRQLIADLLRHSHKEPTSFYQAYDSMMDFLTNKHNSEIIEKELQMRGVFELGFWDVVLDFVLIDSLEDLSHPPSAVLAVTRNMFLSQSVKESTLATVIWSMLKVKRSRLQVKNGFISHFYDISEVISPTITLGFLGTNDHMRELCYYFKEQICSFVVDIFNINRVRYTTIDELVEDVWFILRTRTEMVQTRFSTELIPSG